MKTTRLLAICVLGIVGASLASADVYDPDTTFLAHLDNGSWNAIYALGSPTATAVSCSSVTGKFATAANVGGTLSYSSASHLDVNIGTVEFWMNRDGSSNEDVLWQWTIGNGDDKELRLWLSDSGAKLRFGLYENSTTPDAIKSSYFYTSDMDINAWNHVALSWTEVIADGDTLFVIQIGLNGSRAKTSTPYDATGSGASSCVFNPGATATAFDEIRMLHEFRSTADLAADAAMTVPFTPEPTTMVLLGLGSSAVLLRRKR